MAVVFKLAMLTIRTASKPVANILKGRAKVSPFFRSMCSVSAQQLHQLEMRMSMYMRGQTVKRVRELNDEVAVKNGAEILGEAVMLGIASVILVVEHQRSTADSARKKAYMDQKFAERESRLKELERLMAETEQDNFLLLKEDKTFTKEEIQARLEHEEQRLKRLAGLSTPEKQEKVTDRIARVREEVNRLGAAAVVGRYLSASLLSVMPAKQVDK